MSLTKFIKNTKLQPADCLVLKKQAAKLLDQYLVYLGMNGTRPIFLANYNKGTRILSKSEVAVFEKDFAAENIYRFNGNKLQRNSAVERALGMRDASSYHLILNNCKHYTNAIQVNKHKTEADALGKGLMVT